jgi:hypothetical protein
MLLLVSLGIAGCAGQYFSRRSFWHDEAFLIANLRQKSPLQLLGHLDVRPQQPQAAPPIFLWIEKAMMHWLGPGELSLRLPAFVLALLSIPLMARLAWLMLPATAAVGALGLFAMCDRLILHAAEAKPYSGDVFFSCLLLWMAVEGRPARLSTRRAMLLSLASAVGIWWSYPLVFIFAAIVLSLLIKSKQAGGIDWLRMALLIAPAAVSLAVLRQLCLRHQLDPLLYTLWKSKMIDWRRPWQLLVETWDLVNYLAIWAAPIVLVLAVCGAWAVRRHLSLCILLCGPILLCAAAAIVQKYPYGGSRAVMFLLPCLCMLAGAGFAWLLTLKNPWVAWLAWIAMVTANVILLVGLVYYLILPRTRSHIRPAIEYMRGHYQSGDHIYVIGDTTSEDYLCYRPRRDRRTVLHCTAEQRFPPGRAWLIFAGPPGNVDGEVRASLLNAGDAQILGGFHYRGGAAVLLRQSGSSVTEATSQPSRFRFHP